MLLNKPIVDALNPWTKLLMHEQLQTKCMENKHKAKKMQHEGHQRVINIVGFGWWYIVLPHEI